MKAKANGFKSISHECYSRHSMTTVIFKTVSTVQVEFTGLLNYHSWLDKSSLEHEFFLTS